MTHLTKDPIAIQYWIDQYRHTEVGAMELFIGFTRNSPEDDGIVSLYYEAYEEMVLAEAVALENFMKQKYPLIRDLLIIHRIGEVPVSEPSLLVILTGSHRQTLFQAMEEYIDLLKKKLPIWKKGIYQDGHEQWLMNHF
ncbi:MAG: molybdenum cofactor biosynthesis protein MoaE [Caldisericia bacterium]|nr:molybdenum cofactor biosynthesis protein MoaE [Caldisericia bacterium]